MEDSAFDFYNCHPLGGCPSAPRCHHASSVLLFEDQNIVFENMTVFFCFYFAIMMSRNGLAFHLRCLTAKIYTGLQVRHNCNSICYSSEVEPSELVIGKL